MPPDSLKENGLVGSAEQLQGLALEEGWVVVEPVNVPIGATGGNFSHGYIVKNKDGRRAFLKALDYSRALTAPDPARALQALTESFNFERDVLEKCKEQRLDRVVTAITDGKVTAPDGGVVQYLIFELADGNARSQADLGKRFELAWSLRALHHVSVGLKQLHGVGIAHQDVKPSNVLVFDRTESKVGDLGRAAYQGHTPPHHDSQVAGDPAYAPPEFLYGAVDPGWNRRRFGCDAYLMGSMVVFFFSGVGMTALLRAQLPDALSWEIWTGTYDQVLPYVRDAFGRAVDEFLQSGHSAIRDDLATVVRELCDPDPTLRGHPLNRNRLGNQYSLERYVSKFDLLARRAELGVLGPPS